MAFIHGSSKGAGGARGAWVDGVDSMLPAGQEDVGLVNGQRGRRHAERRRGTDSGRFFATQSVFSCSSLAMMMI